MDFTLTESVIYGTIMLLIVYDIFILLDKGVEQTISSVLLKLGQKYPIIPFGIGVVFGHIFWPNI